MNKEPVIFINSVIFTIAFSLPLLLSHYFHHQVISYESILWLVIDSILTIFFVFPLLYLCSISRVLLLLVYIISGLVAYFCYQLDLQINGDLIASIFEANYHEIQDFINLELILVGAISSALGLICLYSLKHSKVTPRNHRKLLFVSLIFFVCCLVGGKQLSTRPAIFQVLQESIFYWLDKARILPQRLDIAQNFTYQLDERSKALHLVLIIGEAARTDHFALSGYERSTNPSLAREENLVYYKDVTACYPLTRTALPCMLTRATRDNKSISSQETSFIGIFKKLNFTTAWIGMQGAMGLNAPYLDFANEADTLLLPSTYAALAGKNDLALLPFVEQFYQGQSSANLLILHTNGSHFNYEDRYEERFRQFTPICPKEKYWFSATHCSRDELINSYDNSILATDYFIALVIDQLRDKNALLIYVPDHGESLGENGRFLHGTHDADEQIAVPMIFWASDAYIKAYPENYKRLRLLQNKAISHDYLFHSILGCSGISGKIINSQLDLCSPRP